MNFVYGAIAVILSLVVSKIFVKKGASSGRVLGFTFLLEYIVISSLGFIFYYFNIGFFAVDMPLSDALLRIFGFSVFLGVIVASKALNGLKSLGFD